MKGLTDALVARLKVSEKQASGGAAVLFRAARDKLGPGEFDELLGDVAGLKGLVGKAPEPGGAGRMFGGLAAVLGGGNAAILANIVTSFGSLGLTQDDARQFVPVILDYLRPRIGEARLERLERTLRS